MAQHRLGKLHSVPNKGRTLGSTTTGLRRMGLDTDRDGAMYVPESFTPGQPTPLIVSLHGAGGTSHHGIAPFKDLADHTGAILLAPESQGKTWDLIVSGYGKDVYWIDEALSDIFALYPIDPERVAVAGFSDGASYALSLGIANGQLFSHIMAFSPGFLAPSDAKEAPPIYISHGTEDRVLPINSCSRIIVPQLKTAGFKVNYHEFQGGHTIPADIAKDAFTWFLGEDVAEEVEHSRIPSKQSGIEKT